MPTKEFDNVGHMKGQMSLDIGVSGGAIGAALREQLAKDLRQRVGANGGRPSDVAVDMVSDTTTSITVYVRDELSDAQKVAIKNSFSTVMADIGAVEAGKSMAGDPTSGLKAMLRRGGIS